MTTLAELEARLREAHLARIKAECDYARRITSPYSDAVDIDLSLTRAADQSMACSEALLALLEARMREQGREVRRGGE